MSGRAAFAPASEDPYDLLARQQAAVQAPIHLLQSMHCRVLQWTTRPSLPGSKIGCNGAFRAWATILAPAVPRPCGAAARHPRQWCHPAGVTIRKSRGASSRQRAVSSPHSSSSSSSGSARPPGAAPPRPPGPAAAPPRRLAAAQQATARLSARMPAGPAADPTRGTGVAAVRPPSRQSGGPAGQRTTSGSRHATATGRRLAQAGRRLAQAGRRPAQAGRRPAQAGRRPAQAGRRPAQAGRRLAAMPPH